MTLRSKSSLQQHSSFLIRWSTPPKSSKAWKFQLEEKLKGQPVLSWAEREEVSAGTRTRTSLADAVLEVITPCVYVASCLWEAQRVSQTLSHCFSLSFPGTPSTDKVEWFSHNHQVAESEAGLRSPDFWHCSLLIASWSSQDRWPASWGRNNLL